MIGLKTPPRELKFTISQDEVGTLRPKEGEMIYVGKFWKDLKIEVTIKGSVFRDGDFAMEPGVERKSLSKVEGLKEDAL
jgi:hypothetical protein